MANPSPDASSATDAELLQAGFRYALSLSHHSEDAEDLVQQAWLNLCRSYGGVENRAILFTTVRNLFIDQLRRKKIVQFDELGEAAATVPSDGLEEEPGLKGDLEALLAILRPAEREVLFLHYHQGHTAEEIGQLTDRPRNTVLSIAHRAIAKLRAAAAKPGSKLRNHILLFLVSLP